MQQDILLISYQTEDFDQLKITLAQSQISVSQTVEIPSAIALLEQHSPAFLLLDLDMENSEHFLQHILKNAFIDPLPYILIAASRSEGLDRAAVYNLGADAYVEKPIDPQEVIALIHAMLRRQDKIIRSQTDRSDSCIEHREIKIYPLSHIVTMRGEIVALAPKEFDILHLLAKKPGTVFRKEEIYEEVWREQHECAASRVTDNIHSLRLKLGLDSKNSDYIQTVHSIGYRFAKLE